MENIRELYKIIEELYFSQLDADDIFTVKASDYEEE